ncbi:hypothetical protein BZG36_04766 [Bifiguratus adelaidae]|uniref:Uncharacterized protein n=1 Tax=Bifiguratus adelaidae TaxID=1938954 RepID=A0A261XVN3_9FUNG|nr:hypothetical protein BZG36_04766 [Bifiguratus adelaidae]
MEQYPALVEEDPCLQFLETEPGEVAEQHVNDGPHRLSSSSQPFSSQDHIPRQDVPSFLIDGNALIQATFAADNNVFGDNAAQDNLTSFQTDGFIDDLWSSDVPEENPLRTELTIPDYQEPAEASWDHTTYSQVDNACHTDDIILDHAYQPDWEGILHLQTLQDQTPEPYGASWNLSTFNSQLKVDTERMSEHLLSSFASRNNGMPIRLSLRESCLQGIRVRQNTTFDLDSMYSTATCLSVARQGIQLCLNASPTWNLPRHNHEYVSVTVADNQHVPESMARKSIPMWQVPHFLFGQFGHMNACKLYLFAPHLYSPTCDGPSKVKWRDIDEFYEHFVWPAVRQSYPTDVLQHLRLESISGPLPSRGSTEEAHGLPRSKTRFQTLPGHSLEQVWTTIQANIQNSRSALRNRWASCFLHCCIEGRKLVYKFRSWEDWAIICQSLEHHVDFDKLTGIKYDIGMEVCLEHQSALAGSRQALVLLHKKAATEAWLSRNHISSSKQRLYSFSHTNDAHHGCGESIDADASGISYVSCYNSIKNVWADARAPDPFQHVPTAAYVAQDDHAQDALYISLRRALYKSGHANVTSRSTAQQSLDRICQRLNHALANASTRTFGVRYEYRVAHRWVHPLVNALIDSPDLSPRHYILDAHQLVSLPWFVLSSKDIAEFLQLKLRVYKDMLVKATTQQDHVLAWTAEILLKTTLISSPAEWHSITRGTRRMPVTVDRRSPDRYNVPVLVQGRFTASVQEDGAYQGMERIGQRNAKAKLAISQRARLLRRLTHQCGGTNTQPESMDALVLAILDQYQFDLTTLLKRRGLWKDGDVQSSCLDLTSRAAVSNHVRWLRLYDGAGRSTIHDQFNLYFPRQAPWSYSSGGWQNLLYLGAYAHAMSSLAPVGADRLRHDLERGFVRFNILPYTSSPYRFWRDKSKWITFQ